MRRTVTAGESAFIETTIREEDVRAFAELTGDRNPVHLDADYARGTRFGRQIAHGMYLAGLISAVLGENLPGPGSIYLSQTLKFRAPAYLGDRVTTRVEILSVRDDKPIVTARTTCTNQEGTVLVEGEAVLLLPADAG